MNWLISILIQILALLFYWSLGKGSESTYMHYNIVVLILLSIISIVFACRVFYLKKIGKITRFQFVVDLTLCVVSIVTPYFFNVLVFFLMSQG